MEPDEKKEDGTQELTRFQQLARALFRVNKTDVPKHEPKKRPARSNAEIKP